MSAQPDVPHEPLIPMPDLAPDALRATVARIAPSRVPALTQHLFEATTNAQQTQSLAPLRAFVHSWAVSVAVGRHPERAARLPDREGGLREFDLLGGRGFLSFLAVPRHQCVYIRNVTWCG
ncbi:hypothetical protein ACIBJC_14375 [Streptomyces sp. NPDC050509]|uniref:hypothetical protein n=1 Tax=Streptomyces sp. NPDC050509 TaxID=3365620 RepID=UPI0037A21A11